MEMVQDCARYGVGWHSVEKQMHDHEHSFERVWVREGRSVSVEVVESLS